MNRKNHLAFKIYACLALLCLLFIAPLCAVEKGKAERITTFEELEKAIAQAQARIQTSPKKVEAHFRLAQLLRMEGRFDEAELSLQKALNIESAHSDSLLALSRLYWDTYQFEKGAQVFEKAKALAPDKIKTKLLEAKYAIDKMDFDAADDVYRGILQKNSQSASAICGIAEILYWRNQFKESEKCIRQCLSINPEFSKAYLLQSLIHRIRQENDKWRESGEKAVELDPFDDVARANLANIRVRGQKKMQEAYEQYTLALKINPYSRVAHLYLGKGWTPKDYKEYKIEGDAETVTTLKELLEEGDKALLNLEFDRAEAAFSKVIKLAPSNIKALIGRGTLNYHQGKYKTALTWFFKALDIDFDYGLAHYGISRSLLRLIDRVNVKFAEIERKFADKDTPEPPYLRDVFINYHQLDADLQKILRFAVKPLNKYLKTLKIGGGTFYMIPFHKLLWESPYLARIKGTRTFDLRLWDDVKGCGGFHSTSGMDYEKNVKYLRFNVVAHEFAHQVHSFLTPEQKKEIKRLFLKAKKERITLDFYADFNEWEYFAVGVEAYVSEEKLADQKIGYGHTRSELLAKDLDLYNIIESLNQRESYVENEILAVIQKGRRLRGKDRQEKALKIYEEALKEYGRHPKLLEAIANINKTKKKDTGLKS